MVKMERMEDEIVDVMKVLAEDQLLATLLLDVSGKPTSDWLEQNCPTWRKSLISQHSQWCRILPVPFDPDATVDDTVFIRVYYNHIGFNTNETIGEYQFHIDILCAKSLWLIQHGGKEAIRPYKIAARIKELVGRYGYEGTVRLKFTGGKHLAVNNKFDAFRLYAEDYGIE